MSGSATLVRSLLADGLLDELNLLVHPIAVGHGQRLFEDTPTYPLRLAESTVFTTGVLHLVYTPAEEPKAEEPKAEDTPADAPPNLRPSAPERREDAGLSPLCGGRRWC